MDSSPHYLTIREAAKILRLSETSIQRLVVDQVLTAFRIGRQVRIHPATVDPRIPSPPPVSHTLTVRELADRWRVSERTISRMIQRGELAAVRRRTIVRILVSTVEAYEATGAGTVHQ